MIPHADQALDLLARRLMTTLVPDLKSAYTQADGALTSQLMMVLGAELGYGVERRIQDISAMQNLFAEAALQIQDVQLAERLLQLGQLKPASLTLKDVDTAHDELTKALLVLHEMVDVPESGASSGASSANINRSLINGRIWAYLEAHAARHHIPD